MEKEIEEIISLSYKNRFSLYYKPDYCLVRTYLKDGSQHKEVDKTFMGAVTKMVIFLRSQQKS